MEVHENCTDHLRNNLRLSEVYILNFLQFYCKINGNQFEIVTS